MAEKCGYLHARQKRKRVSRPPDGVDVYKRQPQGRLDGREWDTGWLDFRPNPAGFTGLRVRVDGEAACVWPVSYTHLDVYKRQL